MFVIVPVLLFVVIDLYGPVPELECGLTLLGGVTSTTAVVFVKGCDNGSKVICGETELEPDIKFYDFPDGRSWIGSVEFANLTPSTKYNVQYRDNVVQFVTFPSEDSQPSELVLTFGSCATITTFPWSSLASAFNKIADIQPRLAFFLGDNVYTDVHELVPWYRIPFETAHKRILAQPEVQRVFRTIPS